MDGNPVTRGTVTFVPIGQGPTAWGEIRPDGSYSIGTVGAEGIVPGEYHATVISTGDPPPPPPNMAPAAPPLLTPAKYTRPETSGFRFKIDAGPNTCDLPLVSD